MRQNLCLLFALVFAVASVNGQTYFLNGDAEFLGDDCYQLTPNLLTQNGTVWYADQIDLSEDFTLEFLMNLGSNNANGADGMVFVLQQDGTDFIGESGGGMGYLNFTGTLGIEFDTWQNTNYQDPVGDHIAVVSNGNVSHSSATNLAGPVNMDPLGANEEDGLEHIVKITWQADINLLRVYWDCNLRINLTYNIAANIFNDDPMVYWGFTGATGGASNAQIVCLEENILSVGPDVTICTGASTDIFVAGDPENDYTWSPAEGLDDPTSQSPTASPEVTTDYVVSYLDLCNDVISDTVTVTVTDLIVEIDSNIVLNCDQPEQFLTTEVNFNNDVNYSWETADGNIVIGTTSPGPLIDTPGTYIVNAEYDGICTDSDTLEVIGDWNFEAAIDGVELLTCLQEQIELSVNSETTGDVSYQWSTNGGSIASGIFGPTINAAAAGEYTVIASVNPFCIDTVTVTVPADQEPYTLELLPVGQLDCINAIQQISAVSDGDNPTITWTTADGNFVSGQGGLDPIVDAAGTYDLLLVNPDNGCESEASVTINEDFSVPTISFGEPDTLTCRHPSTLLSPSITGTSYALQWTTTLGNIVSGSTGPAATADAGGWYTLTATSNTSGCSDTDSIEVVVTEDFFLDLTQLTLPNIFTPQGDEFNARYGPFLANDVEFDLVSVMPVYEMKIFNRWGNLVFESSSESPKWDGTTGGVELIPGTYYAVFMYEVDCGTEQKGTLESAVLVIR